MTLLHISSLYLMIQPHTITVIEMKLVIHYIFTFFLME